MGSLSPRARQLAQINEVDEGRLPEGVSGDTSLWRAVLLQNTLDLTMPQNSGRLGRLKDEALKWTFHVSCSVDLQFVCDYAEVEITCYRASMQTFTTQKTRFRLRTPK